MSDLELHKFFDFTEGDLAANRSRRLTPAQQEKLTQSVQSSKRYFRNLSIILILIGLGISYGILKSSVRGALSLQTLLSLRGDDLVQTCVGVAFPWLVIGVFLAIFISMARAKPDFTIESVEGKVNFVKVEKTRSEKSATGSTRTRTYQVYEMRVGKINFHDVNESLLNMVEEGDTYAVCYLPNFGGKILSLELIKK